MATRATVTRFGKSNVPPVLYHVAMREEWMSSATHYSPTLNNAQDRSVPLCDLDRLDEFVSRGYFMQEYAASMRKEEADDSTLSGRVVRFFLSAPLALASLLNGNGTSGNKRFPRPSSERLTGLFTSIHSTEAKMVGHRDCVLIVLSTDRSDLSHDDLAWDYVNLSGAAPDVKYPRLKRPLRKLKDAHAEFPLRYDSKLRIVALPGILELERKFALFREIVSELK